MDYLDNIFQVSVVIFGGLITFKVISGQESDKDKQVEKSDKEKVKINDHKSVSKIVVEADPKPVEITAVLRVVVLNEVVMNNSESPPMIKLQKPVLELKIPLHHGFKKTEILISNVKMINDNWSRKGNQWHCSLESSDIEFNLFCNDNYHCIISLKGSTFTIKNLFSELSKGQVSDLECFILYNRQEPLLAMVKKSPNQDSSEMIPLTDSCEISLQIPVESYLINKPFLGLDKGAVCLLSDSITLVQWNKHLNATYAIRRVLLLIKNDRSLLLSRTNTRQLLIGNDKFAFTTNDDKFTIKRHSTAVLLKYSIIINRSKISTRISDERTQELTNTFEIKIPIDHLLGDNSTIALAVGPSSGESNPSIMFGEELYPVECPNIEYPMKLERNDNVIEMKFSEN